MAHRLAKKVLEWNEPVPDFNSRFPNILESILAVPFQTLGKRSLYPRLYDKAAILFYLMIKNRPFQNGNKRVAVTSLFVFLYKNGYWMKLQAEQLFSIDFWKDEKKTWLHRPEKLQVERLYRITVWVAESEPEFKDGVALALKNFIKKNMVPLEK